MKKELIKILISKYPNKDEKLLISLIKEGKFIINNEKVFFPHLKFDENNINIYYLESKQYVSRGAYKLLEAIDKFKLNLVDLICLDIGSSTGGFVQVELEKGAKKVYAIDVGTNQLDYSLRTNKNVILYEKTNLKGLNQTFFSENIDFVSCDVSFISVKNVFDVCRNFLESKIKLMALIKPQFEASSNLVLKGGIVDEIHHQNIINQIIEYANEKGFKFLDIAKSPIKGYKSKNIEYISLFEKE